MSMELIAIISLGLTVITVGIMLAGLILNGQRTQRTEMNTQIKSLREEMQVEFKTLREEMQVEFKTLREEMQVEFKTVREEIGGLRERMAHLQGLMEGLREAITGRRVAEDPGEYGTN